MMQKHSHPINCHLVKYADVTVLLSLLSGSSLNHRQVLQEFTSSCLELNISKSKEMVVTFSNKQRHPVGPVTTDLQRTVNNCEDHVSHM